ncbi:MAG: hypothetical protein B6D70_06180 [gamma proteobacterium symbiont of Stewartia floridana]|nr:MAG: hypothetical protein B6D70_06180 [gamma proteobacterium symbiont of Stewartia floridana]
MIQVKRPIHSIHTNNADRFHQSGGLDNQQQNHDKLSQLFYMVLGLLLRRILQIVLYLLC